MKPRFLMLSCFLMAGIWAGSIVTYLSTCGADDNVPTADVLLEDEQLARPRLFNRAEEPRTQPYDEQNAPPLVTEQPEEFIFAEPVSPMTTPEVAPSPPSAPVPVAPTGNTPLQDILVPLINELAAPDAPDGEPNKRRQSILNVLTPLITQLVPQVPEVIPTTPPIENTNPISGAFGSLQNLFNGDGNFGDIIKIAIAAFAIFGGAQFGGSDMLFKVILGMFAGKKNFNAILENRVKSSSGGRRRRRLRK